MAKTKPRKHESKSQSKSMLNRVKPSPPKPTPALDTPAILLLRATTALHQGDIEAALPLARRVLSAAIENSQEDILPSLNLLGEIHVELGEIDAAREYFKQAADLDEDGIADEENGGGAEKFLWLAQLSEVGGEESVQWFQKGAGVLRREIQLILERNQTTSDRQGGAILELLEVKRRRLAMALCGIVEVYMTDLSWEEDAEEKCEALVTEATMIASEVSEPWQTLASVRISQMRKDDAKAALTRSLDLWRDLPPENDTVPDFPTRVSLARLLMEVEMEEEAIEVLERLVSEDDSSVEVWYLGGWGLYIMGEKQKKQKVSDDGEQDEDTYKVSWISSRQWLQHSLHLFKIQGYEDLRLGDHAKELIAILNDTLGGPAKDWGKEDGEAGEWEDYGDVNSVDEMAET